MTTMNAFAKTFRFIVMLQRSESIATLDTGSSPTPTRLEYTTIYKRIIIKKDRLFVEHQIF